MYQIRCLNDITHLHKRFSEDFIKTITDDFYLLKKWVDVDDEYTYDNFYSETTMTGAIVILDGTESLSELQGIGLTGGWNGVVPEDIKRFTFDGRLWYRIVVVYTDSCTVTFYVKNLPLSIQKYAEKGGGSCDF